MISYTYIGNCIDDIIIISDRYIVHHEIGLGKDFKRYSYTSPILRKPRTYYLSISSSDILFSENRTAKPSEQTRRPQVVDESGGGWIINKDIFC